MWLISFCLLTSCQISFFTQHGGGYQWNERVAHFIHMHGRADFMFVVFFFALFGSSFLLHFVMKRLATNRKERVP